MQRVFVDNINRDVCKLQDATEVRERVDGKRGF